MAGNRRSWAPLRRRAQALAHDWVAAHAFGDPSIERNQEGPERWCRVMGVAGMHASPTGSCIPERPPCCVPATIMADRRGNDDIPPSQRIVRNSDAPFASILSRY